MERVFTISLLRLIERHRDGEAIDQGLVKQVVDSLVSLGLNDADPNEECLDLYQGQFETPFLDATSKYYAKESETFIAENSISEYLRYAEEQFKEEEDRVERYLNAHTRKPLIAVCEDALIREHADLLWDSFEDLLEKGQLEDLKRLYALLSRIPDGLDPLRKRFELYVKSTGLTAVSRLCAEGGSESEAIDPNSYIDTLLEIYSRNATIVVTGFAGETGFYASLDKACRDFMNSNAATKVSSTRSPELLAQYVDLLLRKNNKTVLEDRQMEAAMEKVMNVFKYIDDKDVFRSFYTRRLSKRLIHGVSQSDEAEANMIAKLKQACGFEYTSKLQRMFTGVCEFANEYSV
jgi:cullin 1